VGLRASLDAVAKRKNPFLSLESNAGRPAHSLVTILTERLQYFACIVDDKVKSDYK
jgi:hypothetical protein